LLGGTLALAMACACYFAVRLAYADHLAQTDSADQVRKALTIVPGNANYWLHWVDLREASGQSGDVGIAHAADADPFNARVWIRAGLNSEMCGDYQRAEQYLLRAAQQSRQFEPRWTLANYYLRRNDEQRFWPWAKSALLWANGDRRLLFELFWEMRPDADTILRRAIPDDPKVLRDYLDFLLHNNRSEAALAVAQKLELRASAEDRDLLLRYTDHMLNERRWQAALSSWNALCLRKVVRYTPLDPDHGQLLTNGAFTAEPLDSGFDWHISRVDGVVAVRADSPSALRFDFSGKQPENCNLVNQFVPLRPGRRYKLHFTYRTEGIAPQTGLQWKVIDASTHAEIPVHPLSLASDQWSEGDVPFAVPSGVQTGRVVLAYRRPPGTVRIDGTIWLRNVGLEPLP
jgi:hypothetical protein